MKLKSRNIYIWLYIVLIVNLFCLNIYSSNARQKPSRQAAIDAYSKGEYEKAFREFSHLLESYSKDPLYKYYLGVCLVKMDSYPENASAYLSDALNGSLDIKNIPDDAWFYLGRSQQMAGKYPDAIKSIIIGESEEEKNDQIYHGISECNEGRGRLRFRFRELIS
jgi:TolA-binding protein